MKRILVFLGLKVAEIGGVFAVFVLLSLTHGWLAMTKIGPPLLEFFDPPLFEPGLGFWANGGMGVVAFFLFVFIPVAIVALIAALAHLLISTNWKWAERITDK